MIARGLSVDDISMAFDDRDKEEFSSVADRSHENLTRFLQEVTELREEVLKLKGGPATLFAEIARLRERLETGRQQVGSLDESSSQPE